jgi:uncharacterized protein YukE
MELRRLAVGNGSSNSVQYTALPGAGYSAGTPSRGGRPNYPDPANWSSPTVSSQNLVADTDALRGVAKNIHHLADTVSGALKAWEGPATEAATGMGTWPAAMQMSDAVSKTAAGVKSFVSDLVEAHTTIATNITSSADNYDDTEQTNATLSKQIQRQIVAGAGTASGWKVAAGGVTQHVNPYYGDNLTPQQQAMATRLNSMDGGSDQQVWNGQYDITSKQTKTDGVSLTQDVSFQPDTSYQNMTFSQINGYIQQTKPDAVAAGADAYGKLVGALTDATGVLASNAQTIADNWGGTNAVNAVSHIQMLHQTATGLQANSYDAGEALNYVAPQLAAAKANPTPAPPTTLSGSQAFSTHTGLDPYDSNLGVANYNAQTQMAALNGHIATAYNAMPTQLQKNLPPPAKTAKPAVTTSVGTPGGTGGLPGPGGTGTLPPGTGTVPPIGTTVPPTGKGPTLSGTGPVPPTTTVPPVTTPAPTPTTGTTPSPVLPTLPTTPTPGSTGDPGDPGDPNLPGDPAGSVPGEPAGSVPGETDIPLPRSLTGLGGTGTGTGSDGVADELPGTAGSSGITSPSLSSTDGAVTTPETGTGSEFPMGGMGMGMGGGSGGGQSRSRQSWQSEDSDVWDPADDAVFSGGSGTGMIGTEAAFAGGGFGTADSGAFSSGSGYSGMPGSAGPGSAYGAGATDSGEGFPMMGGGLGGGQRNNSERQRQSWMQEDADIWDNSDRDVPPVIG